MAAVGAGDRRHLGRHRPVGRADDGADQRDRGRPDAGSIARYSPSASWSRSSSLASSSVRSTELSSSSRACRTSSSRSRCPSCGPARRFWSCNTPGGGSAEWLKGIDDGFDRQRVGAAGARRPRGRRRRRLDPAPPVADGACAVRRRQPPARRIQERRLDRPDEGLRLCADGTVLGVRWACPDRDHRASGRRSRGTTRCSALRRSSSVA